MQEVQLLDLFEGLAGDLGAKQVRPLPDGSLLFVLPGPASGAAGPKDGRPAVVIWHPAGKEGPRRFPGVEGGFSCRGLNTRDLRDFVLRLDRVRQERSLEGLNPFLRPTRPVQIRFSNDLVSDHLSLFLEPKVSRWGPFLLESALMVGDGGFMLAFQSAQDRVVFQIFEAGTKTLGVLQGAHSIPPFLVQVVEDTRSDALKTELEGAVDDYLFHALSLVFHEGQGVVRPDLLADDIDELFDVRDEIPDDAFFIPPEDRGMGTFEALSTVLDADNGIALLLFSHSFCLSKMSFVDRTDYFGAMWNRFSSIPLRLPPGRRMDDTSLREMDIVLGGAEERFAGPFKRVLEDPETRALMILTTCVTDLVGMDVDGFVEQELDKHMARTGHRLPVIRWNAKPYAGSTMKELWSTLLSIADSEKQAQKGCVNLLGFVHDASRQAQEIRGDLAGLGVEVGGFLGPSFHTRVAEKFTEAWGTLVSLDPLSQTEFSSARQLFPQMKFVDVMPPFGLSATTTFLRAAADAAGCGEADPMSAWATTHEETWDALVHRARGHTAAVLVRPRDVAYLVEPGSLYGMNLTALLEEMGFQVLVVLLREQGDHDDSSAHEAALRRLEEHLSTEGGTCRLLTREVTQDGGVSGMIGSLDASLVFSEYPPDRRIVEAGKTFFHPRDFEMGFAGAVRTLRRLLRLAEAGFHRAFPPAPTPQRRG